ncbi:hypothetical protein CEXT_645581 [Caerostris extrusa]|uniref:Uncharacterized protein n=1 Tax=Caerostris extrusa TaxID=172846 RepID=A0AAV4MKT8_CAEEX|nr:hypothetical protein CEXT_645581 [Caerostris extrusa]
MAILWHKRNFYGIPHSLQEMGCSRGQKELPVFPFLKPSPQRLFMPGDLEKNQQTKGKEIKIIMDRKRISKLAPFRKPLEWILSSLDESSGRRLCLLKV